MTMRESGYYPPGAEFDPDAPYNQVEPDMQECPDCKGTGKVYTAWNMNTGECREVSEETWLCLPQDEDTAIMRRSAWVQNEPENCPTCNGEGEIEVAYDNDDWDPFDY